MTGADNLIELFHGYTYSGNALASAAAIGALDTYEEEGLLTRGAELAGYWADALHSLKGLPNIIDIRNLGMIGAIEFDPIPGKPTARAFEAYLKAFEAGVLTRTTGDIMALSPPLIISKAEIDKLFDTLKGIFKTLS
jgi:beta-alanine--pyruvate transaminase